MLQGGIYHGRILLPSEYPFKPPEFILLTPNGRWETSTKICLSISSHHPEHWQPSWSVRTALLALIGFMPTSSNGAIGSLASFQYLLPSHRRQKIPMCRTVSSIHRERHKFTAFLGYQMRRAYPMAKGSAFHQPNDLKE